MCASAEQRQSARRSGRVPGEDHPQASRGALGNPVVSSDVRGLDVGLRWWRYAARRRDETSNKASVCLCMTCPPSRSSESSVQAFFFVEFIYLRYRA